MTGVKRTPFIPLRVVGLRCSVCSSVLLHSSTSCRCTLDVQATQPESMKPTGAQLCSTEALHLPSSPVCRMACPASAVRCRQDWRATRPVSTTLSLRGSSGLIPLTICQGKRQGGEVPPGEKREAAVKTTPRVRRRSLLCQATNCFRPRRFGSSGLCFVTF